MEASKEFIILGKEQEEIQSKIAIRLMRCKLKTPFESPAATSRSNTILLYFIMWLVIFCRVTHRLVSKTTKVAFFTWRGPRFFVL